MKVTPYTTKTGVIVAVIGVVKAASTEYSNESIVGALPGLTSIKTSAPWWVIFVTDFIASSGATTGAPPSVGET
jgi:hypothetical protein